MKVSVVEGSLTDGVESVLVNASNTNALLGSGVSGAIAAACGNGFQAQIDRQLAERYGGPMTPGDVLLTDAGSHPRARWVAHVAVMDYRDGFTGASYPTRETIRAGCGHLWTVVETIGQPITVAMVALGAGTGMLGVREPTIIACETLQAHVALGNSRIGGVTFYGYALHEFLVIAHVVLGAFPDAELAPEARAHLAAARSSFLAD